MRQDTQYTSNMKQTYNITVSQATRGQATYPAPWEYSRTRRWGRTRSKYYSPDPNKLTVVQPGSSFRV